MFTAVMLSASLVLGQTDDAAIESSMLDNEYPRVTRQWSDSTGNYQVEARLVGATKSTVELEKEDGKTITVPLSRLDETSQDIAKDAFPHFFVESKIRDVITQVLDDAAEKGSTNDSRAFQKTLMAKANAELRKMKITLRYRIIDVEKKEPPVGSPIGGDRYQVNYKHIHRWQVTPDSFQSDDTPAGSNYTTGWYAMDAKKIGLVPNKIIPGKTVFEITGVPHLLEHGRDFAWMGRGRKIGSNDRVNVNMTISFAVLEHEIRIYTP